MSIFRDVIARMAVDAEFARHARAHPDEVARSYGLSAEEADKLRGLADAQAATGPNALGARLSKSGIGAGGLVGLMAGMSEAGLVEPTEPEQPGSKFDHLRFNPQPEPPDWSPPDIPAPDGPPPPPADDITADGVTAGQSLGAPGGEVGYYPWPNSPGADPFAGQPSDDAGIIIVNSVPSPADDPDDAGIIVIGSTPDPSADAGIIDDGDNAGIIIVNSVPSPADDPDDAGIVVIGGAPDPTGAGDTVLAEADEDATQLAPPEIKISASAEGPQITTQDTNRVI